MDLHRSNVPPSKDGKLWVMRLKGNVVRPMTIISKNFWGAFTHWTGRATIPCLKRKDLCPGCRLKMPQRWKGYLHCYDHVAHRQVFVEFTPTCARALLEQVAAGQSLRALRIDLRRTSSDNGRLQVQLGAMIDAPHRLAAEIDPHATLMDLWAKDMAVYGYKDLSGEPWEDSAESA